MILGKLFLQNHPTVSVHRWTFEFSIWGGGTEQEENRVLGDKFHDLISGNKSTFLIRFG